MFQAAAAPSPALCTFPTSGSGEGIGSPGYSTLLFSGKTRKGQSVFLKVWSTITSASESLSLKLGSQYPRPLKKWTWIWEFPEFPSSTHPFKEVKESPILDQCQFKGAPVQAVGDGRTSPIHSWICLFKAGFQLSLNMDTLDLRTGKEHQTTAHPCLPHLWEGRELWKSSLCIPQNQCAQAGGHTIENSRPLDSSECQEELSCWCSPCLLQICYPSLGKAQEAFPHCWTPPGLEVEQHESVQAFVGIFLGDPKLGIFPVWES